MSNSTCAVDTVSIDDLLAQAAKTGLNLTTTVTNCPEVCSLAWGNGNPDLSGIGVNISYIFQAVLSIICGPLLCLIYELLKGRASHKSCTERCAVDNDDERWTLHTCSQETLSTLHDSFLDISASFSIPVAIAAIFRITQNAPFYELAFLRPLITMQFLSLLSTSVTAGLFQKPYRRGIQRISIIVLYGLLEFGFYMGLVGSLTANTTSWDLLTELSNACTTYGDIFPWIKHIAPPAKIHLPKITAAEYFNPISKKGWVFSLIISGFISAAILGLIVAALIVIFVVPFVFKVLRGEHFGFLVIPLSLAFAIGMLVELAEMERTRHIMKEITGPSFQDDQWGFAQVIAVFLWMPLCIQLVYYAFCKSFFSFSVALLR